MSSTKEDNPLRDELNKKLAANGYRPRLRSVKRITYEGQQNAVRSNQISHEFEKGEFDSTEIRNANLFLKRLIKEKI